MIHPFLPTTIALISLAAAAHAAVPIIGGPTYDASTMTGYQASASFYLANGDATAFDGFGRATLGKYVGNLTVNQVPVQFGNGTYTEFATPALAGRTITTVDASNAQSIAVGSQRRIDSTGQNPAQQAVRWTNPSQPTVLGNGITGTTVGSYASGIDPLGTAVGTSLRYEASSGGFFGNTLNRPVRWSAGTTAATPLDVSAPGGPTANYNSGDAAGIDAAGTTYGTVYSYQEFGSNSAGNFGHTAVRWNAGGTALTELAHAPAPANGNVTDAINFVRPNGFLAGRTVIETAGVRTLRAPTRWSPDGSVTVLQLPANAVPAGMNFASDLNDTGTVVGRFATKPTGSDGVRPVRWDAGTAAPTLLGMLGTPTDTTSAWALGVNNAGLTVGVQRVVANSNDGIAVLWGSDGVAIDLNTLIDPTSGWRLIEAASITDNGYIAGVGMFDPDGTGPVAAYGRSFLIQVPEPTALAVIGVGAVLIGRRRRA